MLSLGLRYKSGKFFPADMSELANTLRGVRDDPVIRAAADRSTGIDQVTRELIADTFPLEERSSFEIQHEDRFVTGQAFLPFGLEFADTDSYIAIDEYERATKRDEDADYEVVSDTRHGELVELVSSQEHHGFSLMLRDRASISSDGGFGMPKNFFLVDPRGGWNPMIEGVNLRGAPLELLHEIKRFTPEENHYLEFKHFVNPQMAMAMYGLRKLQLEAVTERRKEEASAWRKFDTVLEERLGVNLKERERYREPLGGDGFDYVLPRPYKRDEEASVTKHVANLETELEGLEIGGLYPVNAMNPEGRVRRLYSEGESLFSHDWEDLFNYDTWKDVRRYADYRARLLSFGRATNRLRTLSRAIDLAFLKHGFEGEPAPGDERRPTWNVPEWEESDKGRLEWPWQFMRFEDDLSLGYRIHPSKPVEVTPDALEEENPSTQTLYIG